MAESPIVEQVAAKIGAAVHASRFDDLNLRASAESIVALVGEQCVEFLREQMFPEAADLLATWIAREVSR